MAETNVAQIPVEGKLVGIGEIKFSYVLDRASGEVMRLVKTPELLRTIGAGQGENPVSRAKEETLLKQARQHAWDATIKGNEIRIPIASGKVAICMQHPLAKEYTIVGVNSISLRPASAEQLGLGEGEVAFVRQKIVAQRMESKIRGLPPEAQQLARDIEAAERMRTRREREEPKRPPHRPGRK